MRLYHAAALLVLAAVPSAWAAEPEIQAPKSVSGDVGDFLTIRVKTDGKSVKFYPLTPGLKFFPADLLNDPKAAVVTAAKPGRYKLLAYTGNADGPSQPAVIEIVIGDPPAPTPNPPGPDPAPQPADPLSKALGDAYAAEPAADKLAKAKDFAAVMAEAATYCDDPTLNDSADLAAKVTAKRKQIVGDALPALRAAVGKHLTETYGAGVFTLNADNRAKLKASYTKIAQTVTGVAK